MSQSSLFTKNAIFYPHRQTPVEHHHEYISSPKPKFTLEEHEKCWERLTQDEVGMKPMVTSIALHDATLSKMGMQAWVYDMFRRASLNADTIFGLPAYKELVYEFLSTLTVHDGDGFRGDYSGWEFQIQQKYFFWSRKEACKVLGFPEYGLCYLATEQQRLTLWKDLTRMDFMGDCPSPYSIKSCAWRYVHRLIATGINCSPVSVDTISKDDLNVMWALEQAEPIDWFDVFSERFRAMQGNYTKLGFVGCTSLITFIAEICNFRFSNCLANYRELDLGMIKKLGMIAYKPLVNDWSDKDEDPSEEENEHESTNRSPQKGKAKIGIGKVRARKNKKIDSEDNWIEVRKVVTTVFRKPREDPIEIDSD